ncbi:hypothetical protein QR680_015402 [Steinernema hermaphroditum]|uniref:Uncharacterized protein n=1 Tax=Steinernema hermaphroditum TaxID=289476 RepID=A0AA39H9G3_9BILA|nr:hypothetical protein QR680_015402 [Steinernema hermaphroditum]
MSPDHPKTQKNGDDGDEEAGGYEACPEMTPEQLAKIAEETGTSVWFEREANTCLFQAFLLVVFVALFMILLLSL